MAQNNYAAGYIQAVKDTIKFIRKSITNKSNELQRLRKASASFSTTDRTAAELDELIKMKIAEEKYLKKVKHEFHEKAVKKGENA